MKVICSIIFLTCLIIQSVEANQLSIGKTAKSPALKIPIHQLAILNGISTEQLYKQRSAEVNKFPKLLSDTYEPDDRIFGSCESTKPWWGIVGMEAYGPGQHAIDGFAKESNYILNPFRLVSAEISNQIPKGGRTELRTIWNPNRLTAKDRENPNFPFIWDCSAVSFDAAKSTAEVTYDITAFNKKVEQVKEKRAIADQIRNFSLIAYNAEDFGFRFIYLDPHKSTGVKPWRHVESVPLRQFLHCGGSCGYPGGCNNMSPYIPELDENALTALPAQAHFKLWHDEPESVGDPAEFTFIINFK